MDNLKLIYRRDDKVIAFMVLPMEEWMADWWYECDFVPSNDTIILRVFLNDEEITELRGAAFEEVAWYFNWDGMHDDFYGEVLKGREDSSESFRLWLTGGD